MIKDDLKFINYKLSFKRRQTRTVQVGEVLIGSEHPLVIQSMLTSHTQDVEVCFNQIKVLNNAGCQMVRLSVMHGKDLEMVPALKKRLQDEGITLPLVADIHFASHLAVGACEFFDKVRINPGNFSDRPKNHIQTQDSEYDLLEGRQKFKEKISPLIVALKKYNRALRIGINHGSLSKRMIQAYGDSPLAMVKSAFEAVELFAEGGINKIVVSLKSSNPLIVQKAYRLFSDEDTSKNAVPLHLGVTEAGNQTMGRIKSLCGIGALLEDGIGDTFRVSLTEDSVNEIVFAKQLLKHIKFQSINNLDKGIQTKDPTNADSLSYKSELEVYRKTNPEIIIGDIKIGGATPIKLGAPKSLLVKIDPKLGVDFFYATGKNQLLIGEPAIKFPVNFVRITKNQDYFDFTDKNYKATILSGKLDIFSLRKVYKSQPKLTCPVGVMLDEELCVSGFDLEIFLATIIGEGLVDFIILNDNFTLQASLRLANILQAMRVKLFETDYVACPSCGRTMFDLQEVTANIKVKTRHLKNVKIGVLGCMVNGPGEMADSDFGYVGSAKDKVDLYLGHKRIKKNIPTQYALSELIELIKKEGRWIEP